MSTGGSPGSTAAAGGASATGGANATGGPVETGGVIGAGGAGSGGVAASGGATSGTPATGGINTTGGTAAGGNTVGHGGNGGVAGNRDGGGTGGASAGASGGARAGGTTGTASAGTGAGGVSASGGDSGNRDGGATSGATGGNSGTGGVAAAGGAASGGTAGVAACATNEIAKCASGTGPLGSEITCDFGGGDGNYEVTVELGGDAAGDAFVDAEMYRRMLPELVTTPGQVQRFLFTVNVRTPEGQPVQVGTTDSVPGLQVYVRGATPELGAICHQTAVKPVMLWIGGDSTVCDQDSTNYTGWGQRLPQFLNGPVDVANYADSGESSGSFLGSSAMFGAIKKRWQSGDWFFIQMGHNDKTTDAATFQSNMTSYVTQAKAAGVNIVLVTPIARVGYALADEHVNSTGANLPQIIRDLGQSQNVPVIDLTVTTWNWIQTIAPKDYFAADSTQSGGYDHTHLGPKGADAVAGFVRDAIRTRPGVPALVPYLR